MNVRSFWRHLSVAFGITLLFFVGAGAGTTLHAQSNPLQWSRPIPLSGALDGSRFPSLVSQDDGTLFLFWGLTEEAQTTVFVTKHENNTWLRPIDVLIGGPRTLAYLDGRSLIHLLLNQNKSLTIAVADTTEATSVQGWNSEKTVSRERGGLFGDILPYPDGKMDVVWQQELDTCNDCYSIVYEKLGVGNEPDLTYRVLSDTEETPQQRLQILRGTDGTLYVMWDTPSSQETHAGVALSISTDQGNQWLDEPRAVAFSDQDVREPLMFLDNANQLVLVYNYGNKDEVYYSISADQGVTWSEPQAIPGLFSNLQAAATDNFAAAMDTRGITHLISSGRASKPQIVPALYHVAWDGKTWTAPIEIYASDLLPENPALVIGNGNELHVSFATRRRSDKEALTSQIWYTHAQTDAPAATRVPLPTFTPPPTETSTAEPPQSPTRLPSPTPLAPVSPDSATDTAAINTQLPILVGVVLVLVILIIVIVWATVIRGRR